MNDRGKLSVTQDLDGAQHQVSRRALTGGLASLAAGALLANAGTAAAAGNASPQAKPPPYDALSLLSTETAIAYLNNVLLQDTYFKKLYDYFTGRGFQIIPERVILALATQPAAGGTAPPSLPFLVAIVPTFVSFAPGAPNHTACSIVVQRERDTSTTTGVEVLVKHNPFSLQQFTMHEIDVHGELTSATVSGKQVSTLEPAEIAALLGAPSVDPAQWDPAVGSITSNDSDLLSSYAFRTLINDHYASPLYPPGAITKLLRQTSSVQKFARANYIRYSGALDSFSGCCSSSSSSNACTSTSSSSFSIRFEISL